MLKFTPEGILLTIGGTEVKVTADELDALAAIWPVMNKARSYVNIDDPINSIEKPMGADHYSTTYGEYED